MRRRGVPPTRPRPCRRAAAWAAPALLATPSSVPPPLTAPPTPAAGDPTAPRPAPPPTPDALLRALARARSATELEAADVLAEVCAYVRACRAAGLPPERVLVAVKAVAAESGLTPQRAGEPPGPLEWVVRWCIEEYYRPT